jgi:hypothetical protein
MPVVMFNINVNTGFLFTDLFCYNVGMNTKKPFWYAFVAIAYIVILVTVMFSAESWVPEEDNMAMPIAMLGLLVLSVAIMGFLFLSEPLRLFLENQKREAVTFFLKTVGIFACFVFLSAVLIFLL